MPSFDAVSHMSVFNHLPRSDRRAGASFVTQRHAWVALLLLQTATACATGPKPGMGASVDFTDGAGGEATLASFTGKVVVLDVCASWATACNLNARVLDELAEALAARGHRDDVVVLTLLLDDEVIGREAMRSYRETLGVQHAVVLASSRVRAGTSILGEASYVPRIVIFDRTGAVRLDDNGGVIHLEGLLARVEPLLRQRITGR